MKFTCEKSVLETALLPVSRVVSNHATLPILENILVEANADGVRLAATDLEIGMKTFISAKVEESGITTIPARPFSEVVARLNEGVLGISLDESRNRVQLEGESCHYQFNVLSADGYPVLPETPKDGKISLTQSQLKKMIRDVLFAASPPREDNPILTGVLMKLEKDVMTLVTLDGYRLASRISKTSKSSASRSLILPAKALSELSKTLEDSTENVEIFFGEHQVSFKVKETLFFSRLLDGKFPQYERVIPKKLDLEVKVNREALLQALRRASILAQERESPRLVKMQLSGNKLSITANTQDLGQAYEEVKVEVKNSGETKGEVGIAFNSKYLIDALTVLESEKVRFELNSPVDAGVLREEKGEESLYVVMPVRTAEELVAA